MLNSHMYRHHREAVGLMHASTDHSRPDPVDYLLENSIQAYNEPVLDASLLTSSSDEKEFVGASVTARIDPIAQSVPAATFLLQLRESHQISQAATADIVTGCRTLFENTGNMKLRLLLIGQVLVLKLFQD